MTVTVRRMWEGGPLRQWSDKSHGSGWNYYENSQMKGYAGSYVCGKCSNPVVGVYRVDAGDWICAACKSGKMPQKRVMSEKQLETLRTARISRHRAKLDSEGRIDNPQDEENHHEP